MYARLRNKPLWKLVVDMTPQQLVDSAAWRYISDAITREEALEMLTKLEPGKKEREAKVQQVGYPAYVTSAGWMGMVMPFRPCLSVADQEHQATATRRSLASPRRPSLLGSTPSR